MSRTTARSPAPWRCRSCGVVRGCATPPPRAPAPPGGVRPVRGCRQPPGGPARPRSGGRRAHRYPSPMDPSRMLAFAGVALLVILFPGPSVLFMVSRSLSLGRRHALVTIAGNQLGEFAQVCAVALGIGAVVAASARRLHRHQAPGRGLPRLPGRAEVRSLKPLHVSPPDPQPARRGRVLWQAFVVGVSNPKTTVFFAAVLPSSPTRGLVTSPPAPGARPAVGGHRAGPRHLQWALRRRHRPRLAGRLEVEVQPDPRGRRDGDDRAGCGARRLRASDLELTRGWLPCHTAVPGGGFGRNPGSPSQQLLIEAGLDAQAGPPAIPVCAAAIPGTIGA